MLRAAVAFCLALLAGCSGAMSSSAPDLEDRRGDSAPPSTEAGSSPEADAPDSGSLSPETGPSFEAAASPDARGFPDSGLPTKDATPAPDSAPPPSCDVGTYDVGPDVPWDDCPSSVSQCFYVYAVAGYNSGPVTVYTCEPPGDPECALYTSGSMTAAICCPMGLDTPGSCGPLASP